MGVGHNFVSDFHLVPQVLRDLVEFVFLLLAVFSLRRLWDDLDRLLRYWNSNATAASHMRNMATLLVLTDLVFIGALVNTMIYHYRLDVVAAEFWRRSQERDAGHQG